MFSWSHCFYCSLKPVKSIGKLFTPRLPDLYLLASPESIEVMVLEGGMPSKVLGEGESIYLHTWMYYVRFM
jgi:hypothetical protein